MAHPLDSTPLSLLAISARQQRAATMKILTGANASALAKDMNKLNVLNLLQG